MGLFSDIWDGMFGDSNLRNGYEYLKREDFDSALQEFKKSEYKHPNWWEPQHGLGCALAGKGMYDEALNKIDIALNRVNDDNALPYIYADKFFTIFSRANYLYGKNFILEAAREYEKAIQLFNQKFHYDTIDKYKVNKVLLHCYNNLALCKEYQGDYESAISFYNKVISLNSKYMLAYGNLGMLYYNLRKFDKAILPLEIFCQNNQIAYDVKLYLSYSYFNVGNIKCAEKILKYIFNEAGTFWAIAAGSALGYIYHFLLNNLKLANKVYSKVEKKVNELNIHSLKDISYDVAKEEISLYHLRRALLFNEIKQYENAIKECDRGTTICSNWEYLYLLRGAVYYEMGNFLNAEKDLHYSITLNPNLPNPYIVLSKIYEEKKLFNEAISLAKKSLELDVNCLDAYLRLTELYLSFNKIQDALHYINIAREKFPENLEVIFLCAQVFCELEDFELALNLIKGGMSIASKDKLIKKISLVFLAQRGEIYLRMKEYKKAVSDFNKALKLYKDNNKMCLDILNKKIFCLINLLQNNFLTDILLSFNIKRLIGKIMKITRDNAYGYFNRGFFSLKKGNENQSLNDFERALKLDLRANETIEIISNIYLERKIIDRNSLQLFGNILRYDIPFSKRFKEKLYNFAADLEKSKDYHNANVLYSEVASVDLNFRDVSEKIKLLTKRRIGKYILLKEVGRGGWAIVYKALDISSKRMYAIKELYKELQKDNAAKNILYKELDILSKLNHRNILKVFEYDLFENNYILMEFIDGKNLEDLLIKGESVPIIEFFNIIFQVCDALTYTHNQNILHLDMKPANIMIDMDKNIKLTDFGASKMLNKQTRHTIAEYNQCTFLYASPEQCELMQKDKGWDSDLTEVSDIYSLGVVIYEMLVGETCFVSDDDLELAHFHRFVKPISTIKFKKHIPKDLDRIIMKCLEKEPINRYGSVLDLYKDLKEVEKTIDKEIDIKFSMRASSIFSKLGEMQKRDHKTQQIQIAT